MGYLQSKQLHNQNRAAQHRSIVLAAARPLLETALASDAGRGASPAPAGEDVTPPDWPGPVPEPLPPCHGIHSRKRPLSGPGHNLWKWVSPQLLNRKGEEIFYPVEDSPSDQAWARRLEWAVNSHRDLADGDLSREQTDFERVLRTSQSAVLRRNDRDYIKSLQDQLERAHKSLGDLRRP